MDQRQRLLDFFDTENKRDWEKYRQFLHPDVIWILHSAGIRRICGIEAYLAAMRDAYAGNDNTFVCERLYQGKSGSCIATILVNNLDERSCDVFEFRDGLIYEEHEFILS